MRNNLTLESLYNLKCDEYGLVSFTPIINPFPIETLDAQSIEWDWPYPQLFRGRETTILATRYRVFEVDESDWTLHLIPFYDIDNEATEKDIPAGRQWSFVDMGKSWFMTNGECCCFRFFKDELFGATGKALISTNVKAETACFYAGRLFLAGFADGHSWSTAWQTFWQGLADNAGVTFDFTVGYKPNYIHWSSIGGGDLMFLLSNSWAQTGFVTTARGAAESPYSTTRPMILDFVRRNEWGFIPTEQRGLVRKLLLIESALVAYGDHGVLLMSPFDQEVVHGFGQRLLSSVGIANTGAVAGNGKVHLYISTQGELCMVSKDGWQKLGYREYFEPMLRNEIIVSYDEYRNEFIISDNYKTYILTQYGLSETSQLITSICYSGEGVIGMATNMEYQDREARITFTVQEGTNGIKTISQIGVEGTIDTTAYAAVQSRFDRKSGFVLGDYIELNDNGVAAICEAGVEQKPCLKFDDFEGVKVDKVAITTKNTDNRFVHGYVEDTDAAFANN